MALFGCNQCSSPGAKEAASRNAGKELTVTFESDDAEALSTLQANEGPQVSRTSQAAEVAKRLTNLVDSPISHGLTGHEDHDERVVELLHLTVHLEGPWRLVATGAPVGEVRGSTIVWDASYEVSERTCPLQLLGRNVMMLLEGQTYHGVVTLAGDTPMIRWSDGEVWFKHDSSNECCAI
ncbi:unnamed protein product [Symbiodinium sp. CCMP2592]|nr:unnamed protein product [Symbiodinium sp. CCMP2592]